MPHHRFFFIRICNNRIWVIVRGRYCIFQIDMVAYLKNTIFLLFQPHFNVVAQTNSQSMPTFLIISTIIDILHTFGLKFPFYDETVSRLQRFILCRLELEIINEHQLHLGILRIMFKKVLRYAMRGNHQTFTYLSLFHQHAHSKFALNYCFLLLIKLLNKSIVFLMVFIVIWHLVCNPWTFYLMIDDWWFVKTIEVLLKEYFGSWFFFWRLFNNFLFLLNQHWKIAQLVFLFCLLHMNFERDTRSEGVVFWFVLVPLAPFERELAISHHEDINVAELREFESFKILELEISLDVGFSLLLFFHLLFSHFLQFVLLLLSSVVVLLMEINMNLRLIMNILCYSLKDEVGRLTVLHDHWYRFVRIVRVIWTNLHETMKRKQFMNFYKKLILWASYLECWETQFALIFDYLLEFLMLYDDSRNDFFV